MPLQKGRDAMERSPRRREHDDPINDGTLFLLIRTHVGFNGVSIFARRFHRSLVLLNR